jgi:hypothetical protein
MAQTVTMTLTEFLTARLDEDEAAARDALSGGRLHEPEPWRAVGWPASEHPGPVVLIDPDRVLADVAAKRRILARHYVPRGDDLRTDEDTPAPEWLIRDLASVYADHSDYRDEWRP